MKRSSGARAGAAVALTLALVSGCSAEPSVDGPDPAGKSLGAAELGKLIIAQGDVKGYQVSRPDLSDSFGKSKDGVRVDAARCAPLGYVFTGFAPGDESAHALRMAEEIRRPRTLDMDVTLVSLSSYEGEGASKAMAELSAAVDACADGFKLAAGDSDQTFREVEREKAAGSGDEALAFAATSETGDDEGTSHVQVVRHGRTLAAYYTLNLAKMMSGAAYDVPPALVKAQSAKLK